MARPAPLDSRTATSWAAMAHVFVLDALMSESSWQCDDFAFHGGTSLHLSWRSPRFSEDLDFLISRDVNDVGRVMKAVQRRVQERFLMVDPAIKIELKDRTKDEGRLIHFQVLVSSPERLGKVMVKVEFWKVDAEYLASYPTEFRTPAVNGDLVTSVIHPIPAAKLMTAFCDKLTAFATRPFLKWRDIFDLWWIGTQTNVTLDIEDVARQFLHNLSAYNTREDLSPSAALRLFLEREDEAIFAEAERDLRQWIPEMMWKRLYPDTVRDMVAYARSVLTAVSNQLESAPAPDARDVHGSQP